MTQLLWGMLLCAVSFLGCDSVLGVKELPPGTTVITYASSQCEQCATQKCRKKLNDCKADHDCVAMYEKLAACPVDDPGCRNEAEGHAPQASALPQTYQALDKCRRTQCLDDCYGTGGLGAEYGNNDCQDCIQQACGSEERQCVGTIEDAGADTPPGDCERLGYCVLSDNGWPTPDSWLSCIDERPPDQVLGNLPRCAVKCTDKCAIGHDFRCKGGYGWPPPPSDTKLIDTPIQLNDANPPYGPIASAKVQAQIDCQGSPVAQKTTDQDGLADLQVPPGSRYCFRVTKANDNDWRPYLLYLERPLETYQGTYYQALWSKSELDSFVATHSTKTTLSPDDGVVAVQVRDCWYDLAHGIAVTLTPAASGIQELDLDEKLQTGTPGNTAHVLFLNVPPGPASLTATYQGEENAHKQVSVEAGAVTVVWMFPDTG